MKKGDVIYISGKMTGLPDLGRGKFFDAEKKLREKGFAVLNPASLSEDMPRERYMPICLAMVAQADYVLVLDDWVDSIGAALEVAYADYQGIPIITEEGIEQL